jgi:hypothetical protein
LGDIAGSTGTAVPVCTLDSRGTFATYARAVGKRRAAAPTAVAALGEPS